jgi:tRNA G18 (ribose-2'-O)-methylase SpoU
MMPLVPVHRFDDPRIADYRSVPDPELLRRRGLFVAEGRLVVRTLLTSSRFQALSVLVTETARRSLESVLALRIETLPVYVADRSLLAEIVGFNVHRGCLALGARPVETPVADVLASLPDGALVVVLEGVGNADNVGGVFRNAVAFGADAVLLGPGCCDPLYRKAIRVSIGGTLRMRFATIPGWPDRLEEVRRAGFTLAALTPDADAEDIAGFSRRFDRRGRLALLVGAEGAGLSPEAKAAADLRVRIPMAPGVDSLNVATASGIALHRLGRLTPARAVPVRDVRR